MSKDQAQQLLYAAEKGLLNIARKSLSAEPGIVNSINEVSKFRSRAAPT